MFHLNFRAHLSWRKNSNRNKSKNAIDAMIIEGCVDFRKLYIRNLL